MYYTLVVKMDMKKLLEIGEAREIGSRDEKRYADSLDELVAYGKSRKDVEVTKKEKEDFFRIRFNNVTVTEYESTIALWNRGITESNEYKKDIPANFGDLLLETENEIIVDGQIYKLEKPYKFAEELYKQIKDEPNGFEETEETSLAEYCSRKPEGVKIGRAVEEFYKQIKDEPNGFEEILEEGEIR
jgi:hypothetical protein